MSENTNPFDITDVSDLPADVVDDIRKKNKIAIRGRQQSKVLKLAEMAGRPFTSEELCAAYFRVFGRAPKEASCARMLALHVADGRLVRVARGLYATPSVAETTGGERKPDHADD